MKKIYTFLAISMMAASMTAQTWMNVKNGNGDPVSFEVTPELEVSWGEQPFDTSGIQYEYTDIDLENYIYPEQGAKFNPNLIEFDYENDKVVSLDTIQNIAIIEFAKSAPKLYRGAIIPVIHEDIARALFVLEAQVDGKTATILYRKAAITEIFFNQTITIEDHTPKTRSMPNDYDGTFMKKLKLLNMLGGGLEVKIDDLDINFNDTKFDLKFGDFLLFYGRSLNCPFKRLTAKLGGEVVAKGSFAVEPTFMPSKGWCKDLKISLFRIRKLFFTPTTPPVPVDVDFNIDICGDLNISSSIKRAFHYAQNVGATLKVTVGAEYDFETGKMIPLNSFSFEPVEAKPTMSQLPENVHFTFDASVFPRFKLYFYEFKYAGWGVDLKPIYEKLSFNSIKKNGNIFFDTTFSLGTSIKGFVYVWDFDKHANKYLAETPTFEKEWKSWKSPGDIEDKTKDYCERLNYGGASQCTFNVVDLAYEWNPQTCVPAAAEEMSIEVEKFGTIPDPTINPEYYDEKMNQGNIPQRAVTRGPGSWYSHGIENFRLDKEGNVDVPFTVSTPAGENFKLVARILDGNGDVIKEVEHPTRVGIKAFNAVQTITTKDGSGTFNIQVRDYGAWVHEEGNAMEAYNNVTFSNGEISGYMIAGGRELPSKTFMGAGIWQAQTTPAPLRGEGRKTTLSEGLDYARWAHDKLGISTEGTRYYDTQWNGMAATRAVLPDGEGTITYVGNFIVSIEDGEVRLTTNSFNIVED